MASFLHIFIKPKPGVSAAAVKKRMNLAVDWYQYSTYGWVVKTTSNVARWQTRLKPLVNPGGTLLILKVDPSERQGWITKRFWDWMRKVST